MSNIKTWVHVPKNSDFSIYNLPFGIFSTKNTDPRIGIAIGEQIVDLAALIDLNLLSFSKEIVQKNTLNDFIRQGKHITSSVRTKVQHLLADKNSPLKAHPEALIAQTEAQMHLPVEVGDYTDFYSSMEHATNIGKMFRDPANALLPNWKHIPVGYHGRASSIVVSGTDIQRPKGQVFPKGATQPMFQASARLDFELEMAFIVGKDTQMGTSVSTKEAEDYIFGLVLFNDWSARDIQKWEYVPLGPFLGKSFASAVSPWVVPLEALDPFRVAGPVQEPAVLPYLQYEGKRNYNIHLEVSIQPQNAEEQVVCRSNFQYMYWNMTQQLAHHTVNGCNMRVGDMLASGTISGKDEQSYGSMLELSWAGTKPLTMKDGSTRVFIKDGDTVTLRGYAEKDGIRVGFGEVKNMVIG